MTVKFSPNIPSFIPRWASLPKNIRALVTCRGEDGPAFTGFNIAHHVGDDPYRVARHRDELLAALPGAKRIAWLDQIHGVDVLDIDSFDWQSTPSCDASYASISGDVCAVMTADCLPVLFASRDGQKVAAAHAGWRGLQAGVLETTVLAMQQEPSAITAFLGPAISQMSFEVGGEVRQAFLDVANPSDQSAIAAAFAPSPHEKDKFLANLYALARQRLTRLGLTDISGGGFCTYLDQKRFYSFRREATCGRLVSLIYITE